MSKEITNAMESRLDELDTALLLMANYIGAVEAQRNRDEDTWGDVGTLNHLNEQARELLKAIKNYAFARIED